MALVINQHVTERFAIYNQDCIEMLKAIPSNSIDFCIYSPPFASLYTYSNSERDLGNSRSHSDFYEHYGFVVDELYRVLKPGRLASVHCMNLPTSKERDGFTGLSDFRGDIIAIHTGRNRSQPDNFASPLLVDGRFIHHSEVVIWKDPVTAMQRTKSIRLLYKQLRKDSCASGQGLPDYLVTFRKPGLNPDPVRKFTVKAEVLLEMADKTLTVGGFLEWIQAAVEAYNQVRFTANSDDLGAACAKLHPLFNQDFDSGVNEEASEQEDEDDLIIWTPSKLYHMCKDVLIELKKENQNATVQELLAFVKETVFPVAMWQKYASPVWMDIHIGDTLQKESAREAKDERHVCALQLEVIRRAVKLWTNPGDIVLSPFAGIGSEGFVALEMGRRFVGAELKASYYRQAALNLQRAVVKSSQQSMFTDDADDSNLLTLTA